MKYKHIINSTQEKLETKYPILKNAPLKNIIIEDAYGFFKIKKAQWINKTTKRDAMRFLNHNKQVRLKQQVA
jgi:hypothetical protein